MYTLRAQNEAGALEEHRVRFDHRSRDVGENHLVVRRRAQMTPVQGAPLVALDIDERVKGVDRAKRAPIIEPEPAFAELIGSTRHGKTKRGAAGGELRAPDVDRQIVTGRPAGSDRRRTRDGKAGAKVVALVADIGAADLAVVPPVEALDNPTRQGHGDLLVALADCRRLELRHPLLEIRAAIAAKISGSRRRR